MYPERLTKITKLTFTVMPHFYLRTSRAWTPCPSGSRKRKAGRSGSIRSMGSDRAAEVEGAKEKLLAKLGDRSKN